MIKVTNDMKFFIEKSEGDIVILSAGNSAYYITYFTKKLNIPVACYIDMSAKVEGEFYNGIPIYYSQAIQFWTGKNLRLIIPFQQSEQIL